ncbi:Dyp-type peroxidase [Yersinia enterocolitica]|uniref:Dyp-type peroxidase n=1 Tax=Yersinia enterocolitica TaxID=630 RepID=UPI001C8D44E1|nr:Dyp-type peroxidase [Yersinia enterocolitica]EKN3499930.1 Dyp-type peroxidase [Yersinia enterocolitica]EKN3571310.1 Dyp-type peroxidase [Yersinia enterocolitica]EKN3601214.1 Dyp-type peroxidase [Yersinia enterocolitica]EKN3873465.1 Dyp-type peroxidase [Yersinia enterocolitica]EKN3969196.1 Dyp-type peroxidase [Yersinia enterocolitica]
MTQVQSGILLEHCRFAIFMEAKVQGEFDAIRQGCKKFCQALQELQQQFPNEHLGAVIAFGSDIWHDLSNGQGAKELKPFTALGKAPMIAPATQRDLLIHIQSLRQDINFTLAQAAVAAFGDAIAVEEETHGFRWVEERDFTGFIDGTENPQGESRPEVAVIADGEEDAGGSYVLVQRYEHDLKKWQRIPEHKQEQIVGRTKHGSEELPSDQRPDTSHVSRVDLKENGKGLKILRQSLPYGIASGKHGLYFIAYCARLHNIEQQLLSMFGSIDGKHDLLLGFSKPVTGSYYFAPSLTKLLSL